MNQQIEQNPPTQDLAGTVSRFRRHIPISVAIIAAFLALAYLATKRMTPKYTAATQFSYTPQSAINVDGKSAVAPPASDAQRDAAIDSLLQTVSSLPVAQEALRNPVVIANPAIRKLAKSFDPNAVTPSSDALAAALLSNVKAARVGSTELFSIAYTDANPVTAAQIANVIGDAFLVVQSRQKLGEKSGSADQLRQQVELLRRQAQAADQAVAAYRLSHNLLVDPNALASPYSNPLPQLNAQLADARGQAAQAQSRGAASGGTVVSSGLDTSALSGLREQRAEASRDLAGLLTHYGERNPQVIDARQKVADLDIAIVKEMAAMSRSAQAESSAAAARAASVASSVQQTQSQLAGNIHDSVVLADLQRKADTAHTLYSTLLANLGQQTANTALVQADARKVTPAVPPLSPSSPKLPLNLLVGFALGLGVALAVAYLRERWSQTLSTMDDIRRLLDANYLSSIPTLKSAIDKPKTRDPAEAVVLHPMSSYAEAFRSLAQTLLFDARNAKTSGGRVIGLGSALPREGKTTTTISIARVLAMGATRVVIIDADLRRRQVTQTLVPDVRKGWIEVIRGEASLEEVLIEDQTGAWILPVAPGSEKAQRVFDGDAFATMLAELREGFEVVMIDTAPVLALVDIRTIVPHLDAFALLAHWRSTPVKAIRAALHQLDAVNASVTGIVMTMVDLKTQARSGYGDASYYYNEMKEYYAEN